MSTAPQESQKRRSRRGRRPRNGVSTSPSTNSTRAASNDTQLPSTDLTASSESSAMLEQRLLNTSFKSLSLSTDPTSPSSSRNKPRPNAVQIKPPPSINSLCEIGTHTSLATSLSNNLARGIAECVICCDPIRPHHHIWSCQICYAPHHLSCTKNWASSESSGKGPSWRCPSCNVPQTSLPSSITYVCFCGKLTKPKLDRFLVPHSCGQLCSKRLKCSYNSNLPHENTSEAHSCPIPCHPGPCPTCTITVDVPCHCSQSTRSVLCSSTCKSWSCGSICNRILNCKRHECQNTCHELDCDACDRTFDVACACGRKTKLLKCGPDYDIEKQWRCTEACPIVYKCGHACQQGCHAHALTDTACPNDPSISNTCFCGATVVCRESCSEPIVSCGKVCNKTLLCGHQCQLLCHNGQCECTAKVCIECVCGETKQQIACASEMVARCQIQCGALLSCKRHVCRELCCAGRILKDTRKTGKRKQRRVDELDAHVLLALQASHECSRACGKTLQCKVHTCRLPCHVGACPTCLDASFEELTCHCGHTTLAPPIPCGTSIADLNCPFPCVRPLPCGHPMKSYHTCHSDTQKCPPCVELVPKPCRCGKSKVSAMCFRQERPVCGQRCTSTMHCGHQCSEICHSEQSACVCRGNCTKRRARTCGHVCGRPCKDHKQATSCDMLGACTAKVERRCDCKRISKQVVCKLDENSIPLECDEMCATLARNRQLAEALQVSPEIQAKANAKLESYDVELLELAEKDMALVHRIEQIFTELLLQLETKEKSTASTTLPPTRAHVRKFIHEYAEHWGILSASVDPEPHRTVTLTAKRDMSERPLITLSAVIQMGLQASSQVNVEEKQARLARQKIRKKTSLLAPSHPINALIVSGCTLASKSDLESYLRLFIDPRLSALVVQWEASQEFPGCVDAVIGQSQSAPQQQPHIVQEALQSACKPLTSLLRETGKAQAVCEAWINSSGQAMDVQNLRVVKRTGRSSINCSNFPVISKNELQAM